MKLQDGGQHPRVNDGEPESGAFDSVGVIVEALRLKFGDDAMAVARFQALNASVESTSRWSAIVSRLSA